MITNDENNHEEAFDAWLEHCRARKAPDDMTDRVMGALPEPVVAPNWWDTWGKAALIGGAALVGVARYGVLILVLFAS